VRGKMKTPIISLSFICFLSTALFAESNTSGKVFFNHSTDLSEDGINAFNIKRAYLTLDNDVSESVSYKYKVLEMAVRVGILQ